MKMENQYKTEGELYLLFNLLRHPGPHAESLMIHLMPLGWDNEQVIRHLVSLGKEFNFGFRNFQFDKLMLETTSPETYKKIEKTISGNRRGENNKLLKRFWNNKFSLADIEKELQGSFDKTLDQILGNQVSMLEAVSFDIDISPSAKTKIKNYLNKYIEKFINGKLKFSEKNIYTFERHKELLLSILGNLHSDHGNELVIKSSKLDSNKFLFIHCLMAFEQLDYLRLDSIQVNPEYWQTGKNGYYTAQISLQPSMFKEKETKQRSNTIDKIIIVKPKNGNRFKIIINDDYHQRPLDGDRAKPSWNLLFRVADGDLIEEQEYKSSFDFFNSNEKCRLYTQTGYPKTKILKRESGYIKPAVEMEIITEKAYKQRCKKN